MFKVTHYLNICTGSAAYEPTVNEVQVPVLNRELCNDWLVQLNVTEGMICAGYSEGGKDACQVNISIFSDDIRWWSYILTLEQNQFSAGQQFWYHCVSKY